MSLLLHMWHVTPVVLSTPSPPPLKDKPGSNINSGRTDCAAEHEQCMETCSSGGKVGLFGGNKNPAAGTCTLVCTVIKEGCAR